jgi:hypothetical protein
MLLLMCMLIGLVLLQEYHPLVTRPAPATQFLIVMLLSFFLGMCATFVARLSDRNAAQRAS